MRKMKLFSIRNKMLVLNAAALVFLLAIFLLNVRMNMFENYRRVGKDFNLATEKMFLLGLRDHMLTTKDKELSSLLSIMSKNRKLEKVRIVGSDGAVHFSNDPSEEGKTILSLHPEIGDIKFDTLNRKIRVELDQTRKLYILPIKASAECVKCHGKKAKIAYLNTVMDYKENLKEIESTYDRIFYLSVLVFFLIAVVLALSFDQLISKRLKNFQKGLEEVRRGNLKYRFKFSSEDEISKIEDDFNKMAEELERSKLKNDELNFEKLKNIDKLVTVGNLTAELAHEINNYAAILFSRLDYLKSEFEESKGCDKYADDVDSMLMQVENMAEVTKSILKHSKSGKIDMRRTSVAPIINNARKFFENNLQKRNIELKIYDIPDVEVFIDDRQIEQVFINLISNSIDAIDRNGKIEITGIENDGKVAITISDSGPGISPEQVENIFMPFYTTKNEQKGSGLGLYIVKKILEKNKASIRYIYQKNAGATFELEFEVCYE